MIKNLRPRTALYVLQVVIKYMTYYSRIVYLAGPDVFDKNPLVVGMKKKQQCKAHGYTGLYPLDNVIPQQDSKLDVAKLIFEGNVNLIDKSNIIIANLNNFRGACDSGTMWEVGYGVATGKIVVGYSRTLYTIPELIQKHIYVVKAKDFEECLQQVEEMDFSQHEGSFISLRRDHIYCVDPNPLSDEEIQDADALTAFKIGYMYGTGVTPKVWTSDKRSQVEKYGVESYGCMVEDFGLPYNLMIYFSSELE